MAHPPLLRVLQEEEEEELVEVTCCLPLQSRTCRKLIFKTSLSTWMRCRSRALGQQQPLAALRATPQCRLPEFMVLMMMMVMIMVAACSPLAWVVEQGLSAA